MNEPYLSLRSLVDAFKEAGMPVSRYWIYRQERKGNLTFPKSTTDFKKARGTRKIGAVRLITQTQINEIVVAFLPGGKGYWKYEKN